MKNRKNNFLVIFFSLCVFTLASCSHELKVNETKASQINYEFENDFFTKIYNSFNQSRLVSVESLRYNVLWITVKDFVTKEIVKEGTSISLLNYGVYDFSIELFHFTDEEAMALMEVANTIETVDVNDAPVEDGEVVAENPYTNEEFAKKMSQIVHEKSALYKGTVNGVMVNSEQTYVYVKMNDNPDYVSDKNTCNLLYSFSYWNNNNVTSITAKLYNLTDYLNGKKDGKNCTIKFMNKDQYVEFMGTEEVGFSDDNTACIISIENMKTGKYYIELEVKQDGRYDSTFTGEVLCLDKDIDYVCYYHGGGGQLPLTQNPQIRYYSDSTANGIVVVVPKWKNCNGIECTINPLNSEGDVTSYNSTKMIQEDSDEMRFHFLNPTLNYTYECQIRYYCNGEGCIGSFNHTITPESTIDISYNSATPLSVSFDESNEKLIIGNINNDQFAWNKYSMLGIKDAELYCDIFYDNTSWYYEWGPHESFNIVNIDVNSSLNTLVYDFAEFDDSLDLMHQKECKIKLEYAFIYDDEQYVVPLIPLLPENKALTITPSFKSVYTYEGAVLSAEFNAANNHLIISNVENDKLIWEVLKDENPTECEFKMKLSYLDGAKLKTKQFSVAVDILQEEEITQFEYDLTWEGVGCPELLKMNNQECRIEVYCSCFINDRYREGLMTETPVTFTPVLTSAMIEPEIQIGVDGLLNENVITVSNPYKLPLVSIQITGTYLDKEYTYKMSKELDEATEVPDFYPVQADSLMVSLKYIDKIINEESYVNKGDSENPINIDPKYSSVAIGDVSLIENINEPTINVSSSIDENGKKVFSVSINNITNISELFNTDENPFIDEKMPTQAYYYFDNNPHYINESTAQTYTPTTDSDDIEFWYEYTIIGEDSPYWNDNPKLKQFNFAGLTFSCTQLNNYY